MSYKTETKFSLDLHRSSICKVYAKQLDNLTRYLNIEVRDNGIVIDLTQMNCIARMRAKTSRGRTTFKLCNILEDGTVLVILDDNILNDAGDTRCDLMLLNAVTKEVISSMPFIIHVKQATSKEKEPSPKKYSVFVQLVMLEDRTRKQAEMNYLDLQEKYQIIQTTLQETQIEELIQKLNEELLILKQIANRTYKGRDLTVKFANEILQSSSVWDWLQSRINSNNLDGIYIGDYIPFTLPNDEEFSQNTFHACIAGISEYGYQTFDGERSIGVDFITSECYPMPIPWSFDTKINNTNSGVYALNSYVYSFINSTIYEYMNSDMKSVIYNKKIYAPARNKQGNVDIGTSYSDIGHLWIPYEFEIKHKSSLGNKDNDYGMSMYPIFNVNPDFVIKKDSANNSIKWWTYSAVNNSDNQVIVVNEEGELEQDTINTSSLIYVPICFTMVGDSVGDKYDISNSELYTIAVSCGATAAYTGSPITPKITVFSLKDSELLTQNIDYKVTFKNNTFPSRTLYPESTPEYATVTITGIGKYHGTVIKQFEIVFSKPLLPYVADPVHNPVAVNYLKATPYYVQVPQVTYHSGQDPNITNEIHYGYYTTEYIETFERLIVEFGRHAKATHYIIYVEQNGQIINNASIKQFSTNPNTLQEDRLLLNTDVTTHPTVTVRVRPIILATNGKKYWGESTSITVTI